MKRYRKGYTLERDVMNMCREAGWIAARTAGSHSIIDVIAINPITMEVKLFQCKNKAMTENEKRKEVHKILGKGLYSRWGKATVRVFLAYKEKGIKEFKLEVI
jgi:Holliday junction resolvase